jgi:RNA polymerase sigma factor (sigma-70 family)
MNGCYERARCGDPDAMESVVEALRPRLARMAAYYARCSGEDADDLLQEAWVGLLEALPVLNMEIGSPDQYLIQRARWRLLDAVKRARVRRCANLEEAAADRLVCPVPEHAVAAACASEFAGLLKARQRVILDCLLAGLTWRETGHVLGCTSANVAYHVRQIRRQYEEWSGDRFMAPPAAQAI